jgi:hypothetical protein
MSTSKHLLIALCILLATIVFTIPVMAGWGAGWGTGSVVGFGTVTGLKNAQKDGALVKATIGTYGAALSNGGSSSSGNIPGIVWCSNPGTNNQVAPGVNPVTLAVNFSGNQFIASNQIDQNGKAPFNVHAEPEQSVLNTVLDANVLCPGGNPQQATNWILVDFVPQQFSALLQGYDSSGALLTQAVYDCQLPLNVLQSLTFHQQYPYSCTERLDQRVH